MVGRELEKETFRFAKQNASFYFIATFRFADYIGIDVHKKNWDVAIAPAVGNVRRHTQKASAKALFDFLKKHYPDGDYLAVYESGFSGFSTYYALKELGILCF